MKEIIQNYWNLNLSEYFDGSDFLINQFLLVLALGLCAACVIASLINGKISLLVKKLLRAGAFSEKDARPLSELHLEKDAILRNMLERRSGKLAHFVKEADEKKPTYEEYMAMEKARTEAKKQKFLAFFKKPSEKAEGKSTAPAAEASEPIREARYYISEETKDEVKRFYENDRSTPLHALLFCLLILVLSVILTLAMPSILTLIQKVIG